MFALNLLLALPVIQAPVVPGTLPLPLRAPIHADAVDARAAELASHAAAFTAFSLDSFGVPDVRIDLYASTRRPISAREAVDYMQQFQFESSGFGGDKSATSDERPARSVVLVSAEPALDEALATLFDAEADLVVTFRSLRAEQSCSSAWTVWYTGSGSTGTSFYWYFSADAVGASCGPNRNTNTDPDAYLAFWTGSSWSTLSTSIAVTTIDSVGAYNSACYSNSYRFRVYLYNGGSFSARAQRFTAN